MYTIKSKKVLHFFEANPNLQIDTTLEIFVDAMSHLMKNIKTDMSNDYNSSLLKQIHEVVNGLEKNQEVQNKLLTEVKKDLDENKIEIMEKVGAVMSKHRDYLIENVRETMKSNHLDANKSIHEIIDSVHESLKTKIEMGMGNNDFSKDLLEKMKEEHEKFKNEFNEKWNTETNEEKDKSKVMMVNIESIIKETYKSMDDIMKSRMETFFSSSQNTNQSIFTDIVSRLEKNQCSLNNVDEYFNSQLVSSTKGKQGEKRVEIILSELYPDGEVEDTSGKTACGDYILKRKNKTNVLIDTKDYKTLVPVDEVEKIRRDMEINQCNGLLISHDSGISTKGDMEIGIDDKRVIIYVHNVRYNPDKIQMAINALDHLDEQLRSMNISNEYKISTEMLQKINQEYRIMAEQKERIIDTIKKNTTMAIQEVTKINLVSLSQYLDSKFQNTKTTEFVCDICNDYFGKNRQALSAHKRFCGKKNGTTTSKSNIVVV